jgi:hypothetical protein
MEKNYLGDFNNYHHGVSGAIYTMGDRRLLIENFKYDGTGPDAFFWVGLTGQPSNENGILLAHPFRGKFFHYTDPNAPVLRRFRGETRIVLTLPEGIKVTDLKWISVWCRRFAVNFGDFNFSDRQTSGNTAEDETTTEFIIEQGKYQLRYQNNEIDFVCRHFCHYCLTDLSVDSYDITALVSGEQNIS